MHYLLFTTTGCPKCPEFKALVESQTKIKGEVLDERSAHFSLKVAEYGLSQAPTLLAFSDENKVELETSDLEQADNFFNQLKI